MEQLLGFMIAGADTTACTLAEIMLVLAQHPEIQEKHVYVMLPFPN